MDIIVAACVSQFHDSDDEFELLLAYNDGREIGHAMTRSAARQIADECANAIGDGAPERRTVAGQQSGVSAIEAIEKAMEGVTHTDAPEWIAVAQDGDGPNGGFWTCAAATTESPRYIRADIHNALARQAEALQRENVELREALEPFAAIADQLPIRSVGVPDHKPLWGYDGVELSYGDFHRARALLGGENAE